MEPVEKWVIDNYPALIDYIQIYLNNNDETTYEEAFESVDSVIYGEWRDA